MSKSSSFHIFFSSPSADEVLSWVAVDFACAAGPLTGVVGFPLGEEGLCEFVCAESGVRFGEPST